MVRHIPCDSMWSLALKKYEVVGEEICMNQMILFSANILQIIHFKMHIRYIG